MKSTPDDDIFVVKFDGKFTQAEIWEIYKTSFSQPLLVNNLGTWSEMDGLNLTTLHKYERRKNLMVGIYEIRNCHTFFFSLLIFMCSVSGIQIQMCYLVFKSLHFRHDSYR